MIRRQYIGTGVLAVLAAVVCGAAIEPSVARAEPSSDCLGKASAPQPGGRIRVPPVCAAPQADGQTGDDGFRPAVITFSRAVDLDTGTRVRFARSGGSDSAATFALSTTGRPFDPVQLLTPPAARGQAPGLAFTGTFRPASAPLRSAVLTSGFGLRMHPLLGYARPHAGMDLAAPYGSPIYATSDGMVGAASWRGGYGLTVAIEHGGGVETRYAHMSRFIVAPGQQVHAGEVIGYVGSTGLSTGPHLHYEIREQGRAVNPASTLKR